MSRARVLVVAVALGSFTITILITIVGPAYWMERNIPPQWRADRWEATRDGLVVRRLTEQHCGRLKEGVWLDWSADLQRPILREAPQIQQRCFDEVVQPLVERTQNRASDFEGR